MKTRHHLLLVEDSENDVAIMKRALEHACIKTTLQVVQDGETALAYLNGVGEFGDRQRHPLPGIVFLDLKLPNMSGDDVLAWIREREHLAFIMVVVLTSSEHPEDLRRAYRLGANSYLVKASSAYQLAEQLVEMAEDLNLYWLGAVDPRIHEMTIKEGQQYSRSHRPAPEEQRSDEAEEHTRSYLWRGNAPK